MSSAGTDIAIIGIAGRFPGAQTPAQFWRNLVEGRESVSLFPDLPPAQAGAVGGAKYVPARGVIHDVDLFDPAFFGYSPAEASIMDPQQRLFLECAWEALEDAGYDPGAWPGAIALYAGCTTNTYLLAQFPPEELIKVLNDFQTVIANDKDFLVTRVSYKLNLRGPAVNVQSACSTSLVAVHLACQSLLTGESDMAMAGGVSVRLPQGLGYWHQAGGIYSSDGHCRAFDRKADGTWPGNGLGLVVLRRLADAERDGDHIYAVIKGTAINNDGSAKVGFTAPSVSGQASVIAEAMALGGVAPEEIQYVETHGTGTTLGDPIEIAALAQAFQSAAGSGPRCALGSVKPNIGHLDAAAGITGLIKTALALERGQIPPSLNFESPNANIDFAATPFFVNQSLKEWKTNGKPRHAGVSSFGIGGTNAHAVLAEAPVVARVPEPPGDHLLVFSARSSAQLATMAANLAVHLREHPDLRLGDVAFTTQAGRHPFSHRAAVLAHSIEDATNALAQPELPRLQTSTASANTQVVLLLAADGRVDSVAARALYEKEPVFRKELDQCAAVCGQRIQQLLDPGADAPAALAAQAAFSFSYALAQLWLRSGIVPHALAGDALGECVAACVAGVFPLAEGLALAAWRHNPAGPSPLKKLERPGTPLISLLRGAPLKDEEAVSAEYWSRKPAAEMLPDRAFSAVFTSPDVVVLEAGTGSEAAAMLARHAAQERRSLISSFSREPESNAASGLWLARGRLWLAGAAFDWSKCHHERRYRVPLPTYPFERQRCWIGPPDSSRSVPRHSGASTLTGEQVRHPRPELSTPYQAPETEIQKRLAGLWQELLGIETVGIADNFFDLGGHSLIAVQLVSRLREIFDIAIEPEAVFESADIQELAVAIENALAQQIEGMTEEEAEALLNESAGQ